jgi:hypothetical protein
VLTDLEVDTYFIVLDTFGPGSLGDYIITVEHL